MNNVIEVAILTKSSKNGGYCVAGIEIKSGRWVRLVSSDAESHGALSNENMQYQDRSTCQVLDIVKVPIIRSVPSTYQPENVLIDEHKYWGKVGRMSVEQLLNLHPAEKHSYLLGNAYRYITEDAIDTVGHSLVLVQVSNLVITHPEVRKTRADFIYRGTVYRDMSVTDRDFYNAPDNTSIKNAILVMSLPDAPISERWYYKFVAKIFPN